MKSNDPTGEVLPPPEDYRVWAPSRRRAINAWHAWKKWSTLDPVPYLGLLLFVKAIFATAFLRSSEDTWAGDLYLVISPFTFGDSWYVGLILSFVAALVLAIIWKNIAVRYYYCRSTSKWRRKAGLPPDREPITAVF